MKSKLINIVIFLLGLSLLGWFIYYSDPSRLWEHLKYLGSGFVLILLLYLFEVVIEVWAWQLAVPAQHRTSFFVMFSAALAGSTLNALLPGGQAGEVVKGNLLSGIVPTGTIVSSLVIYNFLFTVTTLLVLGVGSLACLAGGAVELEIALGLLGGVLLTGGVTGLVFFWIRRGAIRDILSAAQRIPFLRKKITEATVAKGERIDREIVSFKRNRTTDYRLSYLLLILARLIAVAEIWLILFLLGKPVSVLMATGLFTAGQLFYYLALFLPTRMGVLEGGSMAIFKIFSMAAPLGLVVELIRRARKLTFNAIGILLLGWLGLYKKRANE